MGLSNLLYGLLSLPLLPFALATTKIDPTPAFHPPPACCSCSLNMFCLSSLLFLSAFSCFFLSPLWPHGTASKPSNPLVSFLYIHIGIPLSRPPFPPPPPKLPSCLLLWFLVFLMFLWHSIAPLSLTHSALGPERWLRRKIEGTLLRYRVVKVNIKVNPVRMYSKQIREAAKRAAKKHEP